MFISRITEKTNQINTHKNTIRYVGTLDTDGRGNMRNERNS